MRNILVLFFSLLSLKLMAQKIDSTHYFLIKSSIKPPFEKMRKHNTGKTENSCLDNEYFIDYILCRDTSSLDLLEFISNRKDLEKFVTTNSQSRNERIEFKKEEIKINIGVGSKYLRELGEIKYDSTYDGIPKNRLFDYKYIVNVNNKVYYGLSFDTLTVSVINSITISINNSEVFSLDSLFFGDLLFPNLYKTELAFRPIECYLSSNHQYIYLYLFGGQKSASYFCKLIISKQARRIIGRIIANSEELSLYHCLSNSDFIGF